MTEPFADHFAEALRSMHATEPQPDRYGALRQIDESTRISEDEGRALYALAAQAGLPHQSHSVGTRA